MPGRATVCRIFLPLCRHTWKSHGYSVVREYVGHGIGRQMHEPPEVPNFGNPGHGPRLLRGMTIAVEPMVNAGSAAIQQMPDGWTVKTADGKKAAHYENTTPDHRRRAGASDGRRRIFGVEYGHCQIKHCKIRRPAGTRETSSSCLRRRGTSSCWLTENGAGWRTPSAKRRKHAVLVRGEPQPGGREDQKRRKNHQ